MFECASFPYGDHDDLVDSTTQAIMRFRQAGVVKMPDDYEETPLPRVHHFPYQEMKSNLNIDIESGLEYIRFFREHTLVNAFYLDKRKILILVYLFKEQHL